MAVCYHESERIFYVHIPKCAGTAIGGGYHPDQGWTGCWLEEQLPGWTMEGLPTGHQPVRTIEHWTGRELSWWNLILLTIRNPFAQQVSQWEFWRDRGLNNARLRRPYHNDDRVACALSFRAFVQDPRSNGPNAICGRRWEFSGGVYRWWAADLQERIPPNVRIVRVEDMPEALHAVLRPYVLSGKFSPLPLSNSVRHAPWASYYDLESMRAVRRKFSWSLATFYPELLTWADEFERLGEVPEVSSAQPERLTAAAV